MVQRETQQQKKAAEKLLEPRGKDQLDLVPCQVIFRVHGSRKVLCIMRHVPGEQEKMLEEEEREEAEQTPCSQAPGPRRAGGAAATAGYGAGRQKHASCRRGVNKPGVVKR